MRYVKRTNVTERLERSLEEFLFADPFVSGVCQQRESSPGALILDHLVANCHEDEGFEDWLCRQVREILAQHVQTDDWQGLPEEWLGTRSQCALDTVQLSAEDQEWLLTRYGNHPEVMAAWREANRHTDQRFAA